MFTFFKKTNKSSEELLKLEIQKLNTSLSACTTSNYKLRVALAKERLNRKAVITFLDKNCSKRLNEDGTTSHTITTFVSDLTTLIITEEDLDK